MYNKLVASTLLPPHFDLHSNVLFQFQDWDKYRYLNSGHNGTHRYKAWMGQRRKTPSESVFYSSTYLQDINQPAVDRQYALTQMLNKSNKHTVSTPAFTVKSMAEVRSAAASEASR